LTVTLDVRGARIKGTGTCWQIADPDPMAHNDPDQTPRVIIEERVVTGLADRVTVQPCSVTLLALDVESP